MNTWLKLSLIIVVVNLASCDSTNNQTETTEIIAESNKELQSLFEEDQSDRKPITGEIDWEIVSGRDSVRLKRVLELVELHDINTSKDYYHAAMIFQHGHDSMASGMAVKMMQKAIELDSTVNKWLLAAAIDRDLQRRGKPQIFGIQFVKNDLDKWVLYDIDTTQITDEQRRSYGVPPLKELQAEAEKMNH